MDSRLYQQLNSTLILRILSENLLAQIREKIENVEQEAANRVTEEIACSSSRPSSSQQAAEAMIGYVGSGSASSNSNSNIEHILGLEGITCTPNPTDDTLWDFQCNNTIYPARLSNLPCPVEIHKTFDHANYYKCVDIGQILVVYENISEMEEAESAPGYHLEGFPSYYPSGLTPPMKRVVERRFLAREHKAVAPPQAEVKEIEKELKSLITTISRDASKVRGKNNSSSTNQSTTQDVNKVIEEVHDDVIDYEPWMDDWGNQPKGIEFDEKDKLCTTHPEVWLTPEEYATILGKEEKKSAAAAAAASETKKKKKESSSATNATTKTKKKKTTKKKKKKVAEEPILTELESSSLTTPSIKKGIPAKKNRIMDEVDAAAAQIVTGDDGDALEVLGDLFDFNAEDDLENFLGGDMV